MTANNKQKTVYIILAIVCTVLFCVAVYFIFYPPSFLTETGDQQRDFIVFSDVGQGDCAIIYSNGYSAIIDSADTNAAGNILNDLSSLNIKTVDVALISHLHADHIGSLQKVAEICEVKNLIMPQILEKSLSAASNVKLFVAKNSGKSYDAIPGMNFKIGEFEITVLGYMNDSKNENNRSIFTMAKIDGIKFLFTGDAEVKAENYLLNQNVNIDCDVLKVSHHGSNTSTSKHFLKAASPDYAVISVGQDNSYNHPHAEILERLEKQNTTVFRTDKDGDITFDMTNGKIETKTQKQPS